MTARPELRLGASALDRLMPMHLRLDGAGLITSVGPTLMRMLPDGAVLGLPLGRVFALCRPAMPAIPATLRQMAGQRLHLQALCAPDLTLRGHALPCDGDGFLINLSFGIWVAEAVRRHGLTVADFAHTDLAVEMLYLVEAKSAVVQELRNLNQRLHGAKLAAEEQALTDTLTGLRNRRALDLGLAEAVARGQPFGLMHMDLDYFKQVNDTLGHAAGDHVLVQVARILTEETRASDLVARVGGDEFVLVLPGVTDVRLMEAIARRVIDRLSQPIDFEGQTCRISASVGLTLSGFYSVPEAEQMLADADEALYRSKRAGRAQAQVHAVAAE